MRSVASDASLELALLGVMGVVRQRHAPAAKPTVATCLNETSDVSQRSCGFYVD